MLTSYPIPGTSVFEAGITGEQLDTIMSNFFEHKIINTYLDIETETNKGNPVLAVIDTTGGILGNSIVGHTVVITGLDTKTGVITYMDSLKGGRVQINIFTNPINFTSKTYAVSGLLNNNTVIKYNNDLNDTLKCNICLR